MKSQQGTTLHGVALRQGRVALTSGTFENVTMVECLVAGNLTVTWNDDSTSVIAFTAGKMNPIDCKKVTITTGTFNIGNE